MREKIRKYENTKIKIIKKIIKYCYILVYESMNEYN